MGIEDWESEEGWGGGREGGGGCRSLKMSPSRSAVYASWEVR